MVWATALHAPAWDRYPPGLVGNGCWSMECGEQIKGEDCCWLHGDSLRGLEWGPMQLGMLLEEEAQTAVEARHHCWVAHAERAAIVASLPIHHPYLCRHWGGSCQSEHMPQGLLQCHSQASASPHAPVHHHLLPDPATVGSRGGSDLSKKASKPQLVTAFITPSHLGGERMLEGDPHAGVWPKPKLSSWDCVTKEAELESLHTAVKVTD